VLTVFTIPPNYQFVVLVSTRHPGRRLQSFDAALVTTLTAGAYTVQVSGNSLRVVTPAPTTLPTGAAQPVGTRVSITLVPPEPGVALLELYAVP
jgi:hypothetical protein